MIILDTNVLSALMHQIPDRQVIAWLNQQPRSSIWTTSVTLLEVRFGLMTMAAGRRRAALMQAFAAVLGHLDHRILPFDAEAAEHSGDLMASRHKKGRPVELRDTMIAGIVLAQHATLATRNTAHFEDTGIPLMNPWTA
jgi:predicted nucleic acid-binding protein